MTLETERFVTIFCSLVFGFSVSRGMVRGSAAWVGLAVVALFIMVLVWRVTDT